MNIHQFPRGTAWRAWRANAIHAVASTAGRQDDLAQEWILKVATHDPADPEDPGAGWVSLDRKLAAALTRISYGDLGRRGRVLPALVLQDTTPS